jgi:hypothetical protein
MENKCKMCPVRRHCRDYGNCGNCDHKKAYESIYRKGYAAGKKDIAPQEITPRLRELAQADREGRIVVLPCKIGDPIYVITQVFNGNKIERAIGSRKIDRIGGNALNPVWVVSTQPYELDFFPSEFGKTVFLTRDEAEAALEKEAGNG